jgi:hypothetical protein
LCCIPTFCLQAGDQGQPQGAGETVAAPANIPAGGADDDNSANGSARNGDHSGSDVDDHEKMMEDDLGCMAALVSDISACRCGVTAFVSHGQVCKLCCTACATQFVLESS